MKKAKFMKAISLSLTTIMIASLLAVPAPQVNAAKKSKTKLSNTSITMKVGQKKTLKLKKYSKLSKKKIKKVKWSVTKKNIVELKSSGKYKQNCKVTAKKAGSTTIKLKYNGKTYKCKVVVKKNKTKSTSTEYEDSTEKKTEEKTTENKTEQSTTENKKEETTTENKSEENTTEENKSEEQTTTQNGTTEDPKVEACTHNWSDFTITKNATCTVDGEKYRTCSNCGEIETEKIVAGHSGNWIIITEASCTNNGEQYRICEKCDTKETKVIDKLSHSYEVESKEPTCTTTGYSKKVCSGCGDITDHVQYKALDHNHEWSITSESTYRNAGSQIPKCTRCGNEKYIFDYTIEETSVPLSDNISDIIYFETTNFNSLYDSRSYIGVDLNKSISFRVIDGDEEDDNTTWYIVNASITDKSCKITVYDIDTHEEINNKTFNYEDRKTLFTEEKYLDYVKEVCNHINYDYNEEQQKRLLNDQIMSLEADHSWIYNTLTVKDYIDNLTFNVENDTRVYIGKEIIGMMLYDMGYLCTQTDAHWYSID